MNSYDLVLRTMCLNLNKVAFNKSDPSESLANLQNSMLDAATSVLPQRKSHPLRKRNVSTRTRDLYNSRNINYENMSKQDRKNASHAITKSNRDDYLAYVDKILVDMESMDRKGNKREVTRLTKLLSGKSHATTTIPSKDLTDSPEQLLS